MLSGLSRAVVLLLVGNPSVGFKNKKPPWPECFVRLVKQYSRTGVAMLQVHPLGYL